MGILISVIFGLSLYFTIVVIFRSIANIILVIETGKQAEDMAPNVIIMVILWTIFYYLKNYQ